MPTSNALFVDTSGWACAMDRSEPLHTQISDLIAQAMRQRRTLVTSNYVLTEVVALVSSRRIHVTHADMVAYLTALRADTHVQLVYIGQTTDEEAWRLVASRPDKQWSLVDTSCLCSCGEWG